MSLIFTKIWRPFMSNRYHGNGHWKILIIEFTPEEKNVQCFIVFSSKMSNRRQILRNLRFPSSFLLKFSSNTRSKMKLMVGAPFMVQSSLIFLALIFLIISFVDGEWWIVERTEGLYILIQTLDILHPVQKNQPNYGQNI